MWRFGSATVAIPPAPVESSIRREMPLRLHSVEIRLVETEQLVTAIESLSPVNKRASHEAHISYLRKRRELLRSQAHLLRIDLLHGGVRPPLETPVSEAPYYILRISCPYCRYRCWSRTPTHRLI